MDLFAVGSCEKFKRRYHLAILILVAGAAVYNAVAFARRREPHLALNVVVDVVIVIVEGRACAQHS